MVTDLENLPAGTKMCHYELIEPVATGGMGTVYKAFESALNRVVAIKVLRNDLASDANQVHYFEEEARAVAALRHPNIVPIHFIGREDALVFFSMAFIQGDNFDQWIVSSRPFTEEDALWFMRQAVAALEFAFKNNIVHLDIKPANFLIDGERTILLTDFGLAERLTRYQKGPYRETYGTPTYVSPEQICRVATDHRTDIYSLGATLYHLWAKEPVYRGKSPTELVWDHLEEPFPFDRALELGIPRGWVALIQKMMEKDPAQRFQDYAELRAALANVDKFSTRLMDAVVECRRTLSIIAVCEAVSKNVQGISTQRMDRMLSLCINFCGHPAETSKKGLHVIFSSADHAMEWATHVLKQISPGDNLIGFRIGIHLGEAILNEGGLKGEGVEMARMLMGDATLGSICVSNTVLDLLEKPVGFKIDPAGQRSLPHSKTEPYQTYVIQVSETNETESRGSTNPFWLMVGLTVFGVMAIILSSYFTMTGELASKSTYPEWLVPYIGDSPQNPPAIGKSPTKDLQIEALAKLDAELQERFRDHSIFKQVSDDYAADRLAADNQLKLNVNSGVPSAQAQLLYSKQVEEAEIKAFNATGLITNVSREIVNNDSQLLNDLLRNPSLKDIWNQYNLKIIQARIDALEGYKQDQKNLTIRQTYLDTVEKAQKEAFEAINKHG